MALCNTCLIEEVLPVSIIERLAVLVLWLVERVGVKSGIVTQFLILGAVHHRILVEHLLESNVSVVTYLGRSSHRTLHCCDDDHTVGTAATVDSCCRSILEDIHALDVRRVNIRKVTHEWDSVEHDQRVVAGVE